MGQVPTEAMRNGDLSEFAELGPLYNPYSTNPVAPYRDRFQCDDANNPIPANADGTQAPGAPCNKIPSNLINPIALEMINLLSPPKRRRYVVRKLHQRTRSETG